MVWLFTDDNGYAILERILIGLIAIFIFYLFLLANKKISKDKNLTIDKMDKIIFFLAFIQIGILVLYFLLYTSTFFLASIRACRLIQEVLLCMLLSYISYDERIQERIFKVVSVSVVLIAAYWFTIAIIQHSQLDYNCKKLYWLTFSSLTFFVSILTIFYGIKALKVIQNFINTSKTNTENSDEAQKAKHLEELKNREIQIYVIILCSFVSSVTQLFWDMLAHHYAKTSKHCTVYYSSHDIETCLLYVFFKFITLFLSALSIYYTFFWRNRKNLEVGGDETDRSLSVFYDYRNDYVDEPPSLNQIQVP